MTGALGNGLGRLVSSSRIGVQRAVRTVCRGPLHE